MTANADSVALPRAAAPAADPSGSVPAFGDMTAEMLGAIFDQSQDCIKLIGTDGRLQYMNRNGLCVMEIDSFCMVDDAQWWTLWPAESQSLIRQAVERASSGERVQLEAFCPTAKGTPRWWDVSVSPLRDGGGAVKGLLSVSRDITSQVAERELRETATAEMSHRLQNAYALAGAMVGSASRGRPELADFAADMMDRMARLGTAQRLLLEAGHGGSVGLKPLVEQLVDPFGSRSTALYTETLPDLALVEEDVRVLALVIGELATNSNKYGAMGLGGSIRITASQMDSALVLHWEERTSTDAPVRPAGSGSGSGHRLVDRALQARGGSLDVRFVDGGLDVEIRLPHRS